MATPDSPLIKEGSENYPQLSRSKLGKELGRSRFSHAKAEHPWALKCFIFFFVLMIVFIAAFVHDFRNVKGDDDFPVTVRLYPIIFMLSSTVWPVAVSVMFVPIPTHVIYRPDDALFFLKLIAAGHSWEDIGRIMNSYFYQRRLWWTNSYFYDGQQCYKFFVRYSKECDDPTIKPFIEQTKRKLSERMAQRWEGIQLPNIN